MKEEGFADLRAKSLDPVASDADASGGSRTGPLELRNHTGQTMTDFAWLIEVSMFGGPAYFEGVAPSSKMTEEWPHFLPTRDPNRAVRFSRREDAERVIFSIHCGRPYAAILESLRAVEHGWCESPVGDAPDALSVRARRKAVSGSQIGKPSPTKGTET